MFIIIRHNCRGWKEHVGSIVSRFLCKLVTLIAKWKPRSWRRERVLVRANRNLCRFFTISPSSAKKRIYLAHGRYFVPDPTILSDKPPNHFSDRFADHSYERTPISGNSRRGIFQGNKGKEGGRKKGPCNEPLVGSMKIFVFFSDGERFLNLALILNENQSRYMFKKRLFLIFHLNRYSNNFMLNFIIRYRMKRISKIQKIHFLVS